MRKISVICFSKLVWVIPPVHEAVLQGQTQTLHLLGIIANPIIYQSKDTQGYTPIIRAIIGQEDSGIGSTNTSNETTNKKVEILLPKYSFANRQLSLKLILETNRKLLHTPDLMGLVPLHWAVECRNRECVQFLLSLGANTLYQTDIGNTALHIAAMKNSPDILSQLIKYCPPGRYHPIQDLQMIIFITYFI